jgi:4a-hydroxytetrahydrobiopterin dehydratase
MPADTFASILTETRVSDLARKQCRPCEGGVDPLDKASVVALLQSLPGWAMEGDDGRKISRTYSFANYYETLAFVNSNAYISHTTDHHPDLFVQYNSCKVTYWTHSINGLSENDFICAAKIDALLAL